MNEYKNLSVTDLREISVVDFENLSVTDLEEIFESICFCIEDLENKKNIHIEYDKDYDHIEDNIYELESLQYDVQSEIECR